MANLALVLLIGVMLVELEVQRFEMVEASQGFVLVTERVLLVIPLHHYNQIFGPFDDIVHAKQCFNFHLLHIDQHEIKNYPIGHHIVDQIDPDYLRLVNPVVQIRGVVGVVVDLCCACILCEYNHLLLRLHVTRSHFV